MSDYRLFEDEPSKYSLMERNRVEPSLKEKKQIERNNIIIEILRVINETKKYDSVFSRAAESRLQRVLKYLRSVQ